MKQKPVEWKAIPHYFARGELCYARGETAAKAVTAAKRYAPSYVRRKFLAREFFDVWFVPLGETIEIDQTGRVSWSAGVQRIETAAQGA